MTMDKNAVLRALRALTMTGQEDFARAIGISRPMLSMIETERSIVTGQIQERIKRRLQVNLDDPRLLELITIRDELDTAIRDYLKPTAA